MEDDINKDIKILESSITGLEETVKNKDKEIQNMVLATEAS